MTTTGHTTHTPNTTGANRADERRARRLPLLLLWILILVVLAAMITTAVVTNHRRTVELQRQHDAIAAQQRMNDAAVAALAEQRHQAVARSLGWELDRMAADRDTIERFATTAWNWSDAAAYQQARQQLIADTGLDPDGWFLGIYMADLSSQTVTNPDGSQIALLDLRGLVSVMDTEPDMWLSRVDRGTTTWVVLVDQGIESTQVAVPEGDTTPRTHRTIPVVVTLDPEGTLIRAEAYAPAGPTQHSMRMS